MKAKVFNEITRYDWLYYSKHFYDARKVYCFCGDERRANSIALRIVWHESKLLKIDNLFVSLTKVIRIPLAPNAQLN